MRKVNVTDFRNNLFHYIELSKSEDIQITKNNKVVAVLSNPEKQYYQNLNELVGCLKDYGVNKDYKELIGEEILRKRGY